MNLLEQPVWTVVPKRLDQLQSCHPSNKYTSIDPRSDYSGANTKQGLITVSSKLLNVPFPSAVNRERTRGIVGVAPQSAEAIDTNVGCKHEGVKNKG